MGANTTGDWYEFAHLTAQTKGEGRPVTVVPLFGGTDVTVARKNVPFYPFFLCLGCIGDRNMSEPASWLLVASLPHYNDKAAVAATRKFDGPRSIKRRKVLRLDCAVLLLHHTLSLLSVCTLYTST